MLDPNKYDFSFTAASLMYKEMIMVAKSILHNTEFNFIEVLGKGKSATGKRYYSELRKRIGNLTSEQLDVLVYGDLTSQKQMCFLAVCKTYGFIKDFTVETLRGKLLVYDYEISDGDYISFLRGKMSSHDELEKLTELSQRKIKQVIFKILEQAGIIDNTKNRMLQPQFLDAKTLDIIKTDNPNWLKVFLISDTDIKIVNA